MIALKKGKALKVNAVFCGEFMKSDHENLEVIDVPTEYTSVSLETNLGKCFDTNIHKPTLAQLEKFQTRDSVFALSSIINLTININKFNPLLEEINAKNYVKPYEENMPKPGRKVEFWKIKNKDKVPYIIYADLECLLVPQKQKFSTTEYNKNRVELQQHKPYTIGYFVKCSNDDSLSYYRSHRGEDCLKWFADEMRQFAVNVKKYPEVIPIVFHELSSYHSHFIIGNITKDFEGKVNLLSISKEEYICFTKYIDGKSIELRFIDSFKFLKCTLAELASNLEECPILKSQTKNLDNFHLLTRKRVFPYAYIDSWSRLEESSLPQKSKFYDLLTDSDISDEDYTHANTVYNNFGCQNLGEYADLSLKTDVLLLADVFEQFRRNCLGEYGLDPAHYYTIDDYAWDCMLKYTKVKLDLPSDVSILEFFEGGMRGGLTQCNKRHVKANNKYLPEYNPAIPQTFLIYDNVNNHYGWAMTQCLPFGGFAWVEDVENFNFNVPIDNPEGYILEVDLEYPESIHDSHSDLPFCPEHRKPPNYNEEKLLATLYNKQRYIVHYRYLIQALNNGLTLKKIHRVLKFKQSAWLKGYVDLNTKLRTNAKNNFEKDFYKLMNNIIFGKSMEKVQTYSSEVKLITQWGGIGGAEGLISNPRFKSGAIFDENFVAIESNKTSIYFNKPHYVGICILDISKIKIYDFHYSYMRSRFSSDKAKLCYNDTDSLIYEVECDDLYEVIKNDALEYFDTSDYPDNNIYGVPRVNKEVLGMMKDVYAGKVMSEFVGIRRKLYATRVEGQDKDKKGLEKTVRDKITFDDYLRCLEGENLKVKQRVIASKNHTVSTIEYSKNAFDNPQGEKEMKFCFILILFKI